MKKHAMTDELLLWWNQGLVFYGCSLKFGLIAKLSSRLLYNIFLMYASLIRPNLLVWFCCCWFFCWFCWSDLLQICCCCWWWWFAAADSAADSATADLLLFDSAAATVAILPLIKIKYIVCFVMCRVAGQSVCCHRHSLNNRRIELVVCCNHLA